MPDEMPPGGWSRGATTPPQFKNTNLTMEMMKSSIPTQEFSRYSDRLLESYDGSETQLYEDLIETDRDSSQSLIDLQVEILYGLDKAPMDYDERGIGHHADYDLLETDSGQDIIAGLGATERQALRIADDEGVPRGEAAERINTLIEAVGTHTRYDSVEADNISYPQAFSRVMNREWIEKAVKGKTMDGVPVEFS